MLVLRQFSFYAIINIINQEGNMYEQTQWLCSSLPHLAGIYKAADPTGSSEWQIVRWKNIEPGSVKPEQVHVLADLTLDGQTRKNRFTTRTEALRYSKKYAKQSQPNAQEKGHMAVWKWQENGAAIYQSVLPINTQRQNSQPAIVAEAKSVTYSPMVRLSDKTNRLLREMAAEDEKTIQTVLDEAIKEHYRRWFFARADAAYKALRADEKAWAEELKEREEWDCTLMDGIDENEIWNEDGSVTILPRQERKSA